ncbi:MAG TPA: SMP-30/gluconolactonase/LRE family protein [Acidimicrobiales bacterium]|nr:SMP-30/gluconolactonase/LRE family protein [Acidimicrobiales bacterium]
MERTVLLDGLGFAEGPRWYDDRLFFSDMGTKQVLAVGLDGKAEEICVVDNRPSGIGWLPDGTMLVVSQNDRRVLKLVDGELQTHADISALASGACNDMVVDGRGNAYVGNPGYDMRNPPNPLPPAEVVLVRADGSAEVVDRQVMFPNGSVVTPDNRTLIVGETMGQRLTAFDIAEDGTLSNRRTFADMTGRGPDGIALDTEGGVWVADANGRACVRVVEGGEVTDVVDVGPAHCFACALGGPDRRTLFLLTGPGFSGAAIKSRTGAIQTTEVDVPGAGWP